MASIHQASGAWNKLCVKLNPTLNIPGCYTTSLLSVGTTWIRPLLAPLLGNSNITDQIPISTSSVIMAESLGDILCHINHSCDANCIITVHDNLVTVTLLRDIPAGTELTLDYTVAGTYGLVFRCCCSSRACPFTQPHVPSLALQWTSLISGFPKAVRRVEPLAKPAGPLSSRGWHHTPLLRCLQGQVSTEVRDKVCTGATQVLLTECGGVQESAAAVQCLQRIDGPLHATSSCMPGAVLNSWLRLWASAGGCGFGKWPGWDENSPVWIAQSDFYTRLSHPHYCFHGAGRYYNPAVLQVRDQHGNFMVQKMIFPIFLEPVSRPPGCMKPAQKNAEVGHWIFVCLFPNLHRIEVGDGFQKDYPFVVAQLARFWDDFCTVTFGYNFGAQSWPASKANIGHQRDAWSCGFYTLNGIAGCSANVAVPLEKDHLDTIKCVLALDLLHGYIYDTTATPASLPASPDDDAAQALPQSGTSTHNLVNTSQQQEPSVSPSIPPGSAPSSPRPDRTTDQSQDLNTQRRAQWRSSGIRERKPDSHRRGRTGRRPCPTQPTVETFQAVNCPEPEHVLLDGSEGLPVQVLCLNLGINGIKRSLHELADYLQHRDVAIVHLQEARLKHTELSKWRKITKQKLPKYAMYAHCHHGTPAKNTAVVTLVRLELTKWISPACLNSADTVLSGRILALKYAPPNLQTPLLLTNVWMPHSGYPADIIRRAHLSVTEWVLSWKAKGYTVMAAGDWNATLTDSQRWGPSAAASQPKVTDVAFRTMLTTTGMLAPAECSSPTWESSTGTCQATLDHVVLTDCSLVKSVFLIHDITTSDHHALLCTLHEEFGSWNSGQHLPIIQQERLDLSNLDNLAPLFQSHLESAQLQCTDLESLEKLMWESAKSVLGVVKQARAKPYLTRTVLSLRKAIRVARRLQRLYTSSHAPSSLGDVWAGLQHWLQEAGNTSQLEVFFHTNPADPQQWAEMSADDVIQHLVQCVKELRASIVTEMRAMQRAQLASNIAKKRTRLTSGKRGIQAAMGKGVADARMTSLHTQHPNVVVAQLQKHTAEEIQAMCLSVDSSCTFPKEEDPHLLQCRPSLLQHVFDLLEVFRRAGVPVSLRLQPTLVDNPLDILATLENFMGTEGKARGMICPTCRSPNLTCLAKVTEAGRSLGWFCETCQQCCTYVEDPSAYDTVPWPEECVQGQRQVPAQESLSPDFRLCTPLEWEDFQHLLQQLPNRKAPGDNLVPGELWKHAPEWAQRILFTTLNDTLQGKPMPAHWRGGTVQFLFKKLPATDMANWRPVCLLNVSYRLYSSILTRRLNRIVEEFGILDQAQEGFRLLRCTRRQIEYILNLIRAAKLQNESIILAFLDFRNAFNSNDVSACLRILRAYNLPDVDLIEEMYHGAFYRARTMDGRFTAPVPLTRGTKQGDPLSPLIFNLTINMLFRMLARSGHVFTCQLNLHGDRTRDPHRVNSRAFADDTALVAHSVVSANAQLKQVEAFNAYTNGAVRPEKCEVTGMNFRTNQPLDVSGVRYKDKPLPSVHPKEAIKYLGAHINLDLSWSAEKQYVRTKTLKAVEQLNNTCYTRGQIMMLFYTCVVPIFRYSAPLVPWTWAELEDIDRLWSRAVKYSLHLPLSFSLAPIFLNKTYGGMGLEPAANFMIKELKIHVQQCLAFHDDVADLLTHTTLEAMRLLGMQSPADVYKVGGDSHVAKALLASTPVLRAHALLLRTYWGSVDWMEVHPPWGQRLAPMVQDWKAISQGNTPPGLDEVAAIHPQISAPDMRVLEKVLVGLHKSHVYKVEDLIAGIGWGLKDFKLLPPSIKVTVTSKDYALFSQYMLRFPTVYNRVHRQQPNIVHMLQYAPPAIAPPLATPEQQADELPLDAAALVELEGLCWSPDDFRGEDTAHCSLDTLVCKHFRPTKGGKWLLYFGQVAAQTHPRDTDLLFRVIYDDGDFEDLNARELESTTNLYLATGSQQADYMGRTEKVQQLTTRWRSLANKRLQDQYTKLQATLTGVVYFVQIPPGDTGAGSWQDSCFKCLPMERSSPLQLHKQQLVAGHLVDSTEHPAFTCNPWQPLGSITKVRANAQGEVSAQECDRLRYWYHRAFHHASLPAGHATQLLSTNASKITSYFPAHSVSRTLAYPKSVDEEDLHPGTSLWSGFTHLANVTFDWTTMRPTVEVEHPFVRVTRKGRWTFFKTESTTPGAIQPGAFTQPKQKLVKSGFAKIGELDTRIGAAVLALVDPPPSWTVLVELAPVKQQPTTPAGPQQAATKKPRHLHWLFAEHLRQSINATQFVGSPPTACSFGFTQVVHNKAVLPLVQDRPSQAATVVWLNGISKQSRAKALPLLKSNRPVLLVVSHKLRTQLQKLLGRPKPWKKVASFPAQSRLMLATNQYDFTPKASSQILEVWANQAAAAKPTVRDIGSFSMPQSPLQSIDRLSEGRWPQFHAQAQDFKYRHAAGIVAATDGSVRKDPDGNMCMGGGVAYLPGPHNLKDTGVHVNGQVSSLVAEGAAAHVLLEDVQTHAPTQDLTILTDSANLMFAMQHCTRRELWRDFSTHSQAQLLGELQKKQAARTAATHWVKITAHTSVEPNERADKLATSAWEDKDAPSRTFEPQDNPNSLYFYKEGQGEDRAPVRVKTDELCDHLIARRAEQVLLTQNKTVRRLSSNGVGRHLWAGVLWQNGPYSVADKIAKRMLQCISNTYPTQKRLHTMGIASNPFCPFCFPRVPETLAHWQQICPQFHDARSKVHNDIWTVVYAALKKHMPTGMDSYREVPVGRTLLTLSGEDSRFKRRQPDGIFVREESRVWTLADFTRGSGSTRADLKKLEDTKHTKYNSLLVALRKNHAHVEFFPLASTFNGAIAEDTWRAFMYRIGIVDIKHQDDVLHIAAQAICLGFSNMVDIRHSSLAHNRTQGT